MFYGCQSSLKLPDSYILNKAKNNIIFEITYERKENDKNKMKIFDKRFIEKNKSKARIIYNGSEFELKEYFEDIDNNYKSKIKILLFLDGNTFDMSYMFYECKTLISLIRIYNLNYYKENNQIIIVNKNNKFSDRNNGNNLKDSNSFYK